MVAVALGGADITVTRTRREKYRGAQGDDEYRTVTEEVPLTELGTDVVLDFVTGRLDQDASLRRVADQFGQLANTATPEFIAATADEFGLQTEDVETLVEMAELISIVGGANSSASSGTDGTASDNVGGDVEGTQAGDRISVADANDRLAELRQDLARSERGERISAAVGGTSLVGGISFQFAVALGGAVLNPAVWGLTILSGIAFLGDFFFASEAERLEERIEADERARDRRNFNDRGQEDKDNNGFPDLGDPRDSKRDPDSNDPSDTGGNGFP